MLNITAAGQRARLGDWLDSAGPLNFITAVILLNALILGLETSPSVRAAAGDWLATVNDLILAVFVVEIALKLYARGPRFFRNGWNVFDFLIVGISLVPTSGPFSILRALRILRVLRLLSTVKRLRMLVDSLLQALPGIGWSAALLLMMFYIFGVMGTELFGKAYPQWFGTLGASMFTLFQVMTLESWSMGVARPVMETHPLAWLYFVPFILISSFMILNLFIAIIVSATQAVHEAEGEEKRIAEVAQARDERHRLLEELQRLREQLDALQNRLDNGSG
jgi:voltage-gated sodium channel